MTYNPTDYRTLQDKPSAAPGTFVFAVYWHQGSIRGDKVVSPAGWYIPEPSEGDTVEAVVDNLPEGDARVHSLWRFDPVAGTIERIDEEAKAVEHHDGSSMLGARDWFLEGK